jgi:hypothetical protein
MPYKHWTDREVRMLRVEKTHLSFEELREKHNFTRGQLLYALYRYKLADLSEKALQYQDFLNQIVASKDQDCSVPKDFWTWLSQVLGFKK